MERFLELQEPWGVRHPAIVKPWSGSWAESVPFLSFEAVRVGGHFPP